MSAAPCLGKMRVSIARWRVLWLSWGGGDGGVLLFVLPFCWIATSVHIPLGLGLGSGPCGGYLDTAETFLGMLHSASGWG